MIWRGLQKSLGRSVILAVIALGAAPAVAQDAVLFRSPDYGGNVTLTYDSDASVNGLLQWSDGVTYIRIMDDPVAGYYFVQFEVVNGFVVTLSPDGRIGFSEGTVPEWVFNGSYEFEASSPSGIYLPGIAAYIPDPYAEAFPDWEAAGVKIPLGFGIGMAFWAVVLGFGVPMRWVREITSAAS